MILVLIIIIFLGLLWHQIHHPRAQLFGQVVYQGPQNKKQVALTFDDGPSSETTLKILEILEKHSIKATFFQLGKNIQKYPQVAEKVKSQGHEIEVHGLDHSPLFCFQSPKTIAEKIQKTKRLIEMSSGSKPKYFRPPYGNRTPWLLKKVKEIDLIPVSWSVDPQDAWLNPAPAKIIQKTISRVKNGSIILLHDGQLSSKAKARQPTVEALPQIIKKVKDKGYTFVTLKELFS